MRVLLIGSGGREHALAWKLAQSPRLDTLFAAPGNPGIAEAATLVTIDVADHDAVRAFCQRERIDLVVIGPEVPLVAGLADDLRAAGIAVFGPGKAAAQVEGSKGFTKALCSEAGIPTASYVQCALRTEALHALDGFDPPYVVKADGLAAGKGVVIAATRDEAEAAIDMMFDGGLGAAGVSVVIEEYLEGEEVSFFALTDGAAIVPFASAQDHKRVGEGDTGPNTGGMGAYSPAPALTPALQARVIAEVIEPTVATLAARGTPYSGVLFAGLMLTSEGPKLIEYNARFGDPETQAMLMRFEGDLLALLHAVATGALAQADASSFSDDFAMTVVMAAKGYPGESVRGCRITGLAEAERDGAKVFHAGTALKEGALIANGGRVLNVAARGCTVAEARDRAYAAVDAIDFADGFCRRDIGWRALAREEQEVSA